MTLTRTEPKPYMTLTLTLTRTLPLPLTLTLILTLTRMLGPSLSPSLSPSRGLILRLSPTSVGVTTPRPGLWLRPGLRRERSLRLGGAS